MRRKKRVRRKICSVCLNEFRVYPKTKQFCSPECKREYHQVNYRRKPRRHPKKKCPNCGEGFSYSRGQKLCRDCQTKKAKEKARLKYHLSSHPSDYWQILNRDNFQCQYCGRTPTRDHIKLHLDHIKPQVDGGKTEIDNLVTTCDKCNIAKSDRPLRNEAEFKKRLQKKDNPIDLQESFEFLSG